MSEQILILGGGFGGLTAAHALRRGLGSEHKITLVDKQPLFFMGLTKLWILAGRREVGEKPGNRTRLTQKGIEFVEGEVTSIDPVGRLVQVGKQKIPFDYLIIAMGADYSIAATPGFSKYAKNLYTESGCAEIRDELRSIAAGSITILVCGLPFKCPPAPYEAAFLIDDLLRTRRVRERVTIRVVTPEPHPLTILGEKAGKLLTDLLSAREIEYQPSQKVKEIRSGVIVMESGKQFAQTLTLAVPVHVPPSAVRSSGLVDASGWIPVNSKTLATSHKGVYAIGDCAGTRNSIGQLIPRAGTLAEAEGKVVAGNLIREVAGEKNIEEFEGKGTCFMEVGAGKAAPVRANFYAEPAAAWEFTPPSVEGLREKQKFLDERMIAWFG